uniref:Glycosyltransferase n=1 Tax=viral metagenome TaxID=1070528 RepID=A0A6M3IR35_9ZZZZ
MNNTKKTKGIIYYTDNRIREPVCSVVRNLIAESGLPIVSCSLSKIQFGTNIVLENRQRSYPTMVEQITTALENLDTEYVFFCEHDCLYPKSHFDFTPPKDDVFFYNINAYRWWIVGGWCITYDQLHSLSGMCCNRELALNHYHARQKAIEEQGLDKIRSREPRWARQFGYEPGTKPRRRGGFSDDTFETWKSEVPIVDIRHTRTFSSPKINLIDFKHKPDNWKQISYKDVPGWDLDKLLDLENIPLPFSLLTNR